MVAKSPGGRLGAARQSRARARANIYGPVFGSTSKHFPFAPRGLERVTIWRRLVPRDTPLVAIGGVALETAPAVAAAGANAVAVISALRVGEEEPEGPRGPGRAAGTCFLVEGGAGGGVVVTLRVLWDLTCSRWPGPGSLRGNRDFKLIIS